MRGSNVSCSLSGIEPLNSVTSEVVPERASQSLSWNSQQYRGYSEWLGAMLARYKREREREKRERKRKKERKREREGKGEGSRPGQTEEDRKKARHASAAPTCLPKASVSCKQAQGREKNRDPSRPQEEKGGRRRRKRREERPDPKAAAPESRKTPRPTAPTPQNLQKEPRNHQTRPRKRYQTKVRTRKFSPTMSEKISSGRTFEKHNLRRSEFFSSVAGQKTVAFSP